MHSIGTRQRGIGRRRAALATIVVLLIGLTLTAVGATTARRSASEQAEERFATSSAEAKAEIERQLASYVEGLRSVGAYVAADPPPTPEALRQRLAQEAIFDRLPFVQSLMFIQRVEPANIEAARARIAGVHPDAAMAALTLLHRPGPYYLISDYIAGPANMAMPIGLDMSPVSTIRTVVDESAQSGNAIVASLRDDPFMATASPFLGETYVRQWMAFDFFIGVPVFDGSGQGGVEHLVGWVGAPVERVDQLLRGAVPNRPDDLGLSLSVDVRNDTTQTTATEAAQVGPPRTDEAGSFTEQMPISVMGIDATLRTWSPPVDTAPRTDLAFALAGLVTSLLIAAVVGLRLRNQDGRLALLVAQEDSRRVEYAIIQSVADPMAVLDDRGVVVLGNQAWDELASGGGRPDAIGSSGSSDRTYVELVTPVSAEAHAALSGGLAEVLAGRRDHIELDLPVDRDGERRWFNVRVTPLHGSEGGAVVIHTDTTEQRRSADDLRRQASRDGLTGLLNRVSIEARADALLHDAVEHGLAIGVIFIDLDDFKSINDTYGHATGDGVLNAAAAAIRRTVRPGDSIGRLGGDEFVVLLSPGVTDREAQRVATRLVAELSKPETIGTFDIAIPASVGVAFVADPSAITRDQLIHRADQAMYAAKQSGGARAFAAGPTSARP